MKTFPEMTDAELDRYIDANVAAVREVAEAVGGIDAALANHLVMGPAILARADIAPFAAKIHGSALEYTVKPHPRFLPYAYEGMAAANGVLVGSAHTGESLWAALPDLPDLKDKTRLGPPGVDVEEFAPGEAGRDPLVVFVGKLIVSKGVDLLLAAWPLVHAKHPRARLQIAGFGAYEDGLRRLHAALDRGDLDDARAVAAAGRGLEGGEEKPLPILSAFLADPPPGYAEAARAAAGSVEWIGRLEHDEVARLLPRRRGPGDAEHLPGGVRDGRGRGRRLRDAAGLRRALGHARGLRAARRRPAARGRAAHLLPGRARRGRGDRRPSRPLVRAPRADPRRGPRDPGRHRRAPLELGGSRPRSARRGGRKPRRIAGPIPLVAGVIWAGKRPAAARQ